MPTSSDDLLRSAAVTLKAMRMTQKAPWHARLALILAVFLPIFLMGAALGTKFGLWGWQAGLGAFAMGGVVLMGLTALVALVSLVIVLRKGRPGRGFAIVGLLVPLGIAALFAPVVMGAGEHPIHDMSTDTSDPPALSDMVMAERAESGANAISAYDVPLGETEQFASAPAPLSGQTYAEIIADRYPELEPLPLGDADKTAAISAIKAAMTDMGFTNIHVDAEAGTVGGQAETFWFGFKDDVVARVDDQEIDFRSISRVGQSDLGANAKRIMELREKVAAKLGD